MSQKKIYFLTWTKVLRRSSVLCSDKLLSFLLMVIPVVIKKALPRLFFGNALATILLYPQMGGQHFDELNIECDLPKSLAYQQRSLTDATIRFPFSWIFTHCFVVGKIILSIFFKGFFSAPRSRLFAISV